MLLILLGMGLLGVVTVFAAGIRFIELSYENEKASVQEILHIKVNEHLKELRKIQRELADFIHREQNFVVSTEKRDSAAIEKILNDQFSQYFTTANILKLEKIYAFDTDFRLIAQSSVGNNNNKQEILCQELIDKAAQRSGVQRLRVKTGLCKSPKQSYFALISPIGGLSLKGYLVTITDPSHRMQQIEGELGDALTVTQPGGEISYRSHAWPHESLLDKYLIISHHHGHKQASSDAHDHNNSDNTYFSLSIARDIEWFETRVNQTVHLSILSAIAIIICGLLVSGLVLNFALRPIYNLQRSSQMLGQGNFIPVADTHFPDIHEVVQSFNFMGGKLTHLIGDLKNAKYEAESASRIKGEFLANMSHEIRTPLTAIIGYAENLLERDISDEKRLSATKTIIQSGEHLREIINDILDLSKIEANQLLVEQLQIKPFDILHNVQEIFSRQASIKGVTFNIHIENEIPEFIQSDPIRVKQILINLCSNALKFTPRGKIDIAVSYDPKIEEMMFQCSDTGIGMTPDELGKIFQPFIQANTSTTREYGGTGLGLTLSRKLADMLGGNLEASSVKGEGSKFTLTIATGKTDNVNMLSDKDYQKSRSEMNYSDALKKSTRLSGNILLAEDTPALQDLASMYISKIGATPSIVSNGKEAVDAAMLGHFDLILMDMQMPVMDGKEAVKLLRQKGFDRPILAMTANAMRGDLEEYLAIGCDDYITKPIDRQRFATTLAKYLPVHEAYSDEETALRSSMLDEEPEFIDILMKFINTLPRYQTDLQSAFEQKDWQTLAEVAHSLKGTAGGYGYPQLTDLAIEIEQATQSKDAAEVEYLLKKINTLIIRIQKGIASE